MTRLSTRLKYNAVTIEEIALDLEDALIALEQNGGTHNSQSFRDALENIELSAIHLSEASRILRSIKR